MIFIYIYFENLIQGFVYINGINLGRYWPLVGPQITLYVPADILKKEGNSIVMVEYQRVNNDNKVKFSDTPRLDGKK